MRNPTSVGPLLALLCASCVLGGALSAQQTAPREVRWRVPSLVWSGRLAPSPDPFEPIVARLGLKPVRALVPIRFDVPDVVEAGPVPRASRWLLGRGARSVRRSASRVRSRLLRPPPPAPSRLTSLLLAGADTTTAGLPFAPDLSNLDVEILGQSELRGDWTRFEPCDAQAQFSCEPNLVPQLNPDIEFGVRVRGNVTDRIRVDVDFDQAREFSAANNINIYYEGKEDEILQLVELGDVTFALPPSRFLTRGIPAGNFGFQATGQAGPIDFRGVWAQQRGDLSTREFRLSGAPGQESFVQADTLVLDDADYVRGQFFFLVDPRELRDYPHIDVLDLDPTAASATVSPGIEPVQVYRLETDLTTRQQVQGLIQADAVAERDGERVEESGWFRYLVPGEDYTIHSSGLWIALDQPLQDDEALAVTYITGTGIPIGDYNPEVIYNSGLRPELRLLGASAANHRPNRPTWDQEMHQIYRVSSATDIDPTSIELTISLGELSAGRTFVRGLGGEDITWLRLFGLDEQSPVDELDQAGVYKPASDLFQDQPPVSGAYIVFPTLRPFQAPPPLESLSLSADEASEILGADANDRIYDAEDPFDRVNGGLFRLTIPFELRSQGVITSFSLGAFAIRDGSERIFLGERLLQRDIDYRIDYDIGQVTLIQPEILFATATDPVVRASWEHKSLFQIAPTTVLGFNGFIEAGKSGGFNLLALHQREQTLVRRPQLGVEPAAITLGGMSLDFDFPASGLDRLVENVPGLRIGGPSRVGIEGELALSFPNPNTRRDVFVDDFDAASERTLSLRSHEWIRGSAPAFRDGAEDVLPIQLDENDVGDLVWQHTWIREGVTGDSLDVFEGFLPQADIDQQISVTGSQTREIGLRMSFGPRSGSADGSWRSITTTLSQSGLDISKSDFLEFYAAGGEPLTLVIDLGNVAEDALFVDEEGRVRGTKSTGVPWGLGLLDHEADPRRGEIWSDVLDQVGVWDESCLADRAAVYRVGDPRANCTRGNGRRDSEDLDGDGNLDALERYRRYIVRLDGGSPFLARSRNETGTTFQLYRIPIRGPQGLGVPGAFTQADFRTVKHLRITVVGDREAEVTLTRMRITGSQWIKRADQGVLTGISGEVTALAGRAEVGPVSRVTEGTAYEAPPGVLEELDDPTTAFGGQGIEFNEKGLKLEYEGIESGDRAEVFNRFPQRPRDFLTYREMRLWAVAREGDWAPDEPLFFFVKIGEDSDNFYLFRSPLTRAMDPEQIRPRDWLPELVVDFDQWIDLRRRAEEALIFNPPEPGGAPLELWSADSTYAVVLTDRARAPNLAAVREVSLGVRNERGMPTSGEVWVNELRLSSAIRDVGVAGHLGVDVDASDVWTTRMTVTTRGAFFRQLDESASFLTERALSLASTLRVDRFTPAAWGVEIPVTVAHTEASEQPTFLAQSDVRAEDIRRLREPRARRTRVDVQFRKSTPSPNPLVGLFLDGLEARAGYFSAETRTITAVSESNGFDARVGYGRNIGARDFALFPEFLRRAVRWLVPGSLGDQVAESRVRWSPERILAAASYARIDRRAFRFDRIAELDEDTLATPTLAPRESLESTVELSLRPFRNLTASAHLVTTRDLLPPAEVVADPRIQSLLAEERSSYGGLDLGWETNRLLRTNVDFSPRFSPWLSGRFGYRTFYASDRKATFVTREVLGPDTTLILERDVNGQRDLSGELTLSPARLVGAAGGGRPAFGSRLLRTVMNRIRPVSLSWLDGVTARFDREPVDPGIGFQLGTGGRDEYLLVDGDSATSLTDRTTWSARSGLQFAGGLQLGVGYRRTDSNTLDTRSDRSRVDRSWPDATARLNAFEPPAWVPALRQISLSAGVRRNTIETTFGGVGLQRRFVENTSIPLQLGMTWGQAVRTDYRATLTDGEGLDPTGRTERERTSHELTLASSFIPPRVFAQHLERPITTTLLFRYTSERNCRTTVGQDVCVAFLDELIRVLNLRFDTAIDQVDLRLQLSYTDRQSFVGLATGNTQFQFGLFGNFRISGGSFRQ